MKYIGKRIIMLFTTLLIVSFLVFLAFTIIPGDPAMSKLGMEATPERLDAFRTENGLNDPLFIRYGNWLYYFIQGDMGTSYSYNMPVGKIIAEKLPITFTLTGIAFLIMITISIPLGLYTAKHEGSLVDKSIMVLNQVVMSIPPFFAGILLTYLFGLILKWFVPGGFVSYKEGIPQFLAYLITPAIAISLPKCAMSIKILRSSLSEQAKLDYSRTAFSKGNTTNGVLYHHVLKNALIPVITFFGMAFTDMIAGSVIIEQVFGIPGIGRILLTSISNRDYPVVQAIIVLIAFLVIVVNLFVDLIYRFIDPRMRQN
ncbi:MAG TPA: ABC transporter permease [Lachnospiraceae bacterium]|nr:ABC transporter permease [Lachnospiraceae bacterium]